MLRFSNNNQTFTPKEAIENLLICPVELSAFEALEFILVSPNGSSTDDHSFIYKPLYHFFSSNINHFDINIAGSSGFDRTRDTSGAWIRIRGLDVIDPVQEAQMSDIQKLSSRYDRFFSKMKEFFPDLDFQSRTDISLSQIKRASTPEIDDTSSSFKSLSL
jgi:hypothetical protein